ncbi:hypothetical protein PSTG_19232, partial [Puccinia striiformis f. sp. tritici PST-78]
MKMLDTERFIAYSTRARSLQNMANFDATPGTAVDDFALAESVYLGSSVELQNLITNHQLLLASPFTYSAFEFRVTGFHEGLRKLRAVRVRPAASSSPSSIASALSFSLRHFLIASTATGRQVADNNKSGLSLRK